ncbi:MAG TPA: SEL1-like repeat protein [Dyella sp.]|uniref:SEL1-like repeat protein n=1 Tax=Dyella sp. TaxID=1869338 RepID=UPI002B95210B|nr:SEL1-like repeat protein [Dyella sp.]HTV86300.1 SEL1-like repeat protein [Dyella sp.]
MFKATWFAACALAAGLGCATAARAQGVTVNGAKPDLSPPPAQATQDNPPPASDKDVVCLQAYEQFLPGDYYACEARVAFGNEKDRKTVDMLEEAAYWANKDAQYALGLTYFNGDFAEVPQNRPLGVAWLALAAERNNPQYKLTYDAALARLTPEEAQQATALWRRMRLKYADKVAEKRAIRRFNQTIGDIDDAARGNNIVYLSGYAPFPQSAFVIANKLHDQATADFANFSGTVVVGKPQWLHAQQPASASSAATPVQ